MTRDCTEIARPSYTSLSRLSLLAEFSAASGKCLIEYDDGDEEWVELGAEPFQWVDRSKAPKAGKAGKQQQQKKKGGAAKKSGGAAKKSGDGKAAGPGVCVVCASCSRKGGRKGGRVCGSLYE